MKPSHECVINITFYSTVQTWSSRDLGLGLETSQDRTLKVSVLVLNNKVLVLVLMPKVSNLVFVLKLGLGLEH